MANQNSQAGQANRNNQQQQQGQIMNAQAQAATSQAQMAPWLTKNATPFGSASPGAAPGALHLGGVPGEAGGAQPQPQPAAVMQPPQGRRAPQGIGAPAAPAQPQHAISPQQAAQIQQIMRGPQTLNTAPVAL